MATPDIQAPSDQDSVGTLVGRLSGDVGRVVRVELALVQARASAMLAAVRAGSPLLVLGMMLALTGIGALVLALILGVMQWLAPWLAALVVGAGLLAVAGLLLAVELRTVTGSVNEALAPGRQLVQERARHGD